MTTTLPPALDAAVSAGQKLRKRLDAMRDALRAGDDAHALELARELCDVPAPEPHANRHREIPCDPGS